MNNSLAIKIKLSIIFLFLSNGIFANPNVLGTYIQVWGFLKYNSPVPSTMNWDNQLISDFYSLQASPTNLDSCLLNLVKICQVKNEGELKNVEYPFFIQPILDLNIPTDVKTSIEYFCQRKKSFKNKYVKPTLGIQNPAFNDDFLFENRIIDKPTLFLSLARFWSAINYFYPYKNQLKAWDEVLYNNIEAFLNISNDKEYYYAVLKIASLLQDGHATVTSTKYNPYLSEYLPPFWVSKINNKTYVSYLKSDSICAKYRIELGDELLAINDIPVNKLWEQKQSIFTSSNLNHGNYRYSQFVLFNSDSIGWIKTVRKNDTIRQLVKFYSINFPFQTKQNIAKSSENLIKEFNLSDKVGYISLTTQNKKSLKKSLDNFINHKYIIIDCRGYPATDFEPIFETYFFERRHPFSIIYTPKYDSPGKLSKADTAYIGGHYKKTVAKIILLVDERTISAMEYLIMGLQTTDNIITIGFQTAGAIGDKSVISLPNGITVGFSGLAVYYADGSSIQKSGVKIDIPVERSTKSLFSDEILMQALHYIQTENIQK